MKGYLCQYISMYSTSRYRYCLCTRHMLKMDWIVNKLPTHFHSKVSIHRLTIGVKFEKVGRITGNRFLERLSIFEYIGLLLSNPTYKEPITTEGSLLVNNILMLRQWLSQGYVQTLTYCIVQCNSQIFESMFLISLLFLLRVDSASMFQAKSPMKTLDELHVCETHTWPWFPTQEERRASSLGAENKEMGNPTNTSMKSDLKSKLATREQLRCFIFTARARSFLYHQVVLKCYGSWI